MYKFKVLVFGIFIAFILSVCPAVNAATNLDPSLKWKTIETLHFKINYYPEIEQSAIKMASIAEEIHSRLSPLFKHVPDLKTDIVLMDTTDYSNGFTTVFPNPLITIYLADIGSNLTPFSYDEWLRYVFIHEYTHLLHLDTVEGGAKLFKFLFGREIFPNALSPRFIIEGLATYIETKKGRGGRGENTRWLAMLRMDALEENFKSIDQASVDTVKWPMGNISYLYGVSFLEYLSKTYGEDKLYRLSQEYGDYLFSYGIDGVFQMIYGKSLWVLWQDWKEAITLDAKKEKERISANGLTKPTRITSSGYYNLKPKWSSDSSGIFFSQNNMDDSSQIKLLDISTKAEKKIIDGAFFDDNFSVQGNKLFFAKGDVYKNFYFYKDLYVFDLISGRKQRLTNGARAADPDISPDSRYLVYTRNNISTRSLWLSEIGANKDAKQLGSRDQEVQYFSPVFMPNGKQIAVAKWEKGRQKIHLIDADSGAEKMMFSGNMSLEANPCVSHDGRYVLFDSDVSGIVNLYAYDLQTSSIYQITNVLGIAEMPAVSPDEKKIAYVNYSSKGYDLAVIDFDPTAWRKVFPSGDAMHISQTLSVETDDLILNRYDYNPLPALVPKFWFPYSFYNENGSHLLAYTAGVDSLMQQYYMIQGGYDWRAKRSSYNINYTNNQFLPQISINLFDWATPYLWDNDSIIYWQRDRGSSIYFSLFDNTVFSEYDRQAISIGYESSILASITSLEVLSIKPNLGTMNGLGLAYRYSSLRSYGYSIAPESGIDISLSMRTYGKELGSDYNLIKYSLLGKTYARAIFPHHVVGINTYLSLTRGDSLVQSGYSFNYLLLRGYPYKLVAGTKSNYNSFKYLLPIAYPESGFGYGSLFFDRLWLELFFDQGGATFGSISDLSWKRSYGAEINLQTVNAFFPITFILGYANGIDTGGEEQVYFSFNL